MAMAAPKAKEALVFEGRVAVAFNAVPKAAEERAHVPFWVSDSACPSWVPAFWGENDADFPIAGESHFLNFSFQHCPL